MSDALYGRQVAAVLCVLKVLLLSTAVVDRHLSTYAPRVLRSPHQLRSQIVVRPCSPWLVQTIFVDERTVVNVVYYYV